MTEDWADTAAAAFLNAVCDDNGKIGDLTIVREILALRLRVVHEIGVGVGLDRAREIVRNVGKP